MTVTNNAAKGFRKRAERMERSVKGLLRREARLCAVSLAFSTQPFGDSKTVLDSGEGATAGDIRRCYATPGQVYADFPEERYAKAFWWRLMRGEFAEAQKIVDAQCPNFRHTRISYFDPRLHQGRRNSRGRISKTQKPLQIVIDPKSLDAYVAAEVKRVGWGKGGWAGCARALDGTRGIPGWVVRHKAPAQVHERHVPGRSEITLVNKVSYASEILDGPRKSQAIDISFDRLFAALVREERAGARAAGF